MSRRRRSRPTARGAAAPRGRAPGSGRAVAFAALVLAVAVWPLAHRALAASVGIDPWRLGGFAMYATYQGSVVALFEPTPEGLRLVDEGALPPRARHALQRFRTRRAALGRWARPDDAVRAVHAARPDLEHLVVVVQRLWLDGDTGRIASEKEILPYVAGEPLADGAPGA